MELFARSAGALQPSIWRVYSSGVYRIPHGRNEGQAYKAMYLCAFEKMLTERRERGLTTYLWSTAQDVYHLWMEDGVMPGQIGFFDDVEGAANEAR